MIFLKQKKLFVSYSWSNTTQRGEGWIVLNKWNEPKGYEDILEIIKQIKKGQKKLAAADTKVIPITWKKM